MCNLATCNGVQAVHAEACRLFGPRRVVCVEPVPGRGASIRWRLSAISPPGCHTRTEPTSSFYPRGNARAAAPRYTTKLPKSGSPGRLLSSARTSRRSRASNLRLGSVESSMLKAERPRTMCLRLIETASWFRSNASRSGLSPSRGTSHSGDATSPSRSGHDSARHSRMPGRLRQAPHRRPQGAEAVALGRQRTRTPQRRRRG